MKKSRFTEEQIIGILREQEAGQKTADVCHRHGASPATFYQWKAKFGGMEVSKAKREAVVHAQALFGVSERRACLIPGAARRTIRYHAKTVR